MARHEGVDLRWQLLAVMTHDGLDLLGEPRQELGRLRAVELRQRGAQVLEPNRAQGEERRGVVRWSRRTGCGVVVGYALRAVLPPGDVTRAEDRDRLIARRALAAGVTDRTVSASVVRCLEA